MRATDITAAMLLLTDQEKQEAAAHFKQGLACGRQEDYAGALLHYTAAAKMGHAGAQNNLAQLYRKGQGVARNDQIAFQLYLDAARHGNLVAQRNVSFLYLRGEGTSKDFETAVAWLETAAERDSVDACLMLADYYQSDGHKDLEKEAFWRRRAAELGDEASRQWVAQCSESQAEPEYLRRRELSMPPMDRARALSSQHREFYSLTWSLPTAAVLGDRLYYLCQNALCVSGLDGSGARILCENLESDNLTVSSAGVFLYSAQWADDRDLLLVQHLGLDGRRIGEYSLDADEYTCGRLYVVDDNLYYDVGKNGKRQLRVYNTTTRTGRILYDRAAEITRLFANERFLVFQARYENGELDGMGWMLCELATGRVTCLDCALSPEQVLDCPDCYDEDSIFYEEDPTSRRIIAFDMAREILWTERHVPEAGGTSLYWEPRPLDAEVKDWHKLVPGVPIWRLDREAWRDASGGQIYFDGDRLFAAPIYHKFYGGARTGEICHWDMSHGHGACEYFLVVGDLLLLDVDAYGEKVYRACPEPSAPIGESWRNTLPPKPEVRPVSPSGPVTISRFTGSQEPQTWDLEAEKALTATNLNYGILTMGSRFHIGFGVPVTVFLDDGIYSGKTHSTAKGRVDGLKQLFTDSALALGDVLRARYVASEGAIYLYRL